MSQHKILVIYQIVFFFFFFFFNKHIYSVLKQKFSYINPIAQKMTQTHVLVIFS